MEIQYHATFYVFIATDNLRKYLEVGITTNLNRCPHLVYYEPYTAAISGVKREMKLATFSQRRLRQLVLKNNPDLKFLNTG